MIASLIDDLLTDRAVPVERLEAAFDGALRGELSDAQLAGLLVALRSATPTAEVLVGAVQSIRSHQTPFPTIKRQRIDTCGTGGDGSSTFNVSTASALVVAAAGGCVAKHGNRSVSSSSGSADVLEALGVPVDLEPERAQRALEEHGFAFLFAPRYHPAMKRVASVRREPGVRTLFNLLGPLLNPTGASRQLVGVYAPELTQLIAQALSELGSERALVVHCDGMDEIGLHAVTRGHLAENGTVYEFECDPTELGLQRAALGELAVEGAQESAKVIEGILSGQDGPHSDVVLLNAGAALFVHGLADSIGHGLESARETVRDGRGRALLERLREAS